MEQSEAMKAVAKKLRRMLGREHLDSVHIDLINILAGLDMREEMLALMAEKDETHAMYVRYYNG